MRRAALPIGLALALAAAAPAAPARATMLRATSLEELCGSAHRVVRAECLGSERRYDPARRRAYRYTTFRVEETLSGPPAGETIVIRVISLGDTFAIQNSIPVFKPGDRAVLFLTPANADGYPYLVGLRMGCYRIEGSEAVQSTPSPPAPAPVSGQAVRHFVPQERLSTLESMIRGSAP